MKKAALSIIIFLGFVLVAFLPFWNSFFRKVNSDEAKKTENSFLFFKSIDGEYSIFVDDKLVGEVGSKEEKDLIPVDLGVHKIKIVRKSEIPNYFYILERNIEFIPSAKVEIEWEAGPTLESSNGIVQYFTEIEKNDGAELYVLPFPANARIALDGKEGTTNLFQINDTATHSVRVSNGDGFEPKSLDLNLTDQSTNKVLKNKKLIVEIYLYKAPFN